MGTSGKPELGDVYEIPCPDGRVGLGRLVARFESESEAGWRFAGDWLEFLPDVHDRVPEEPCVAFEPTGVVGWLEHGFVENWLRFRDIVWVGRCPLEVALDWRTFRAKQSPTWSRDGAVVSTWLVVQGDQEWLYESLPPECDDLPSLALRDGRSLGPRVMAGWRPRYKVDEWGRQVRERR
jgi:hypothetical protein